MGKACRRRDKSIECAMLTAHVEPPVARSRPPAHRDPTCRLCGAKLHRSLIDLGTMPLVNRTLAPHEPDPPAYPLHARSCDSCMLVQVSDVAAPELVATPTPFLSSRSATSVEQARRYADAMRKRHRLTSDSLVIEIGSNDGYLLRHFQAAGVPVLGIEPARQAAAAAADRGIPTEIAYFNTETAMEFAVRLGTADLVVANNVLPHVADLFDFAAGFASILRPNGVVVLQVPHLLSLVQRLQFDAFRHDIYGYFSLQVLERILRSVGLRVFDAVRVPDHGGSLRVQACHAVGPHPPRQGLKTVRQAEASAALDTRELYTGFSARVAQTKAEISDFLDLRMTAGRRVAAYGAAARGASLLNVCGLNADHITCVADPDPARQGRVLPGSRVPIVPLQHLLDQPPNDLIVLPWTNVTEVVARLEPLRRLGTQIWTVLPRIARV